MGHGHMGTYNDEEKVPICKFWDIKLKMKHVVTECIRYERNRHRVEMKEILDTKLGTETKNNVKIIQFLKLTNFYNAIKKM